MIIKDSDKNKPVKLKRGGYFKKNRIRNTGIFLLFVLLIISGFVASNKVKTKGYNGLYDFIRTVCSNYINGMDAKPEQISIVIKNKDFKILEENRRNALERGVIINDMDGEYVPAELEYRNRKMKIKLRLKGHMTDHLQENKWSFRIKVVNKELFMGMKRFTIQHPGTRGYIYEWIYHELMRRAGVIALRYTFINVSVNGKDWGIYAVEENFEKELIENNQRKKGPILRFDPDMYWVHRYNMMKKESAVDEFASYYSSNPVAYREEDILKDSAQLVEYRKGIALMEGIRSKKIRVEDAFDIPLLAKFHAIIDLVGGQHAIDWSDIKYYFNPLTERLEPVAYESFTQFPIRELSGMYRFIKLDSAVYHADWHTTLFSDPAFFRAYTQALKQISDPAYLDAFFAENEEALKQNMAILSKEFPFKKFDKELYYKSQHMIKKMLAPPKALLAYFNGTTENSISLQVGNTESLPVEIKSITVGDVKIELQKPVILPCKQPNVIVDFNDYVIPLPSAFKWDDTQAEMLKINYCILGQSTLKQERIFSFPHPDDAFDYNELNNQAGNVKKISWLTIDEKAKSITVKQGKQNVKEDVVIPAGYTFLVLPGTELDLQNRAKIISYSPLLLLGEEEDPVIVRSSDSSGQGLILLNTHGSRFEYAQFINLPFINDPQLPRHSAITAYNSKITVKNCSFYSSDARYMMAFMRSSFHIYGCTFSNAKGNVLKVDFSTGSVSECYIENCSKTAITANRSVISLKSVYLKNIGNKTIQAEGGTQITGGKITMENTKSGMEIREAGLVSLTDVTAIKVDEAIVIDRDSPENTYSNVKIASLKAVDVKKNIQKENGSVVEIRYVQ